MNHLPSLLSLMEKHQLSTSDVRSILEAFEGRKMGKNTIRRWVKGEVRTPGWCVLVVKDHFRN